MTHNEVTAAMKAEDVDAGLVSLAEDALMANCDEKIGAEQCTCPTEPQIRRILAAVLTEVRARALEDEAGRIVNNRLVHTDRTGSALVRRARALRAARPTATTEEPTT